MQTRNCWVFSCKPWFLFTLTFFIQNKIAHTQIEDPICSEPPDAIGNNCLNDLAQFKKPTCTANDVRIAAFNVLSGPSTCVSGTTIGVGLQAQTIATANERYSIGYYIALDGGDAKTGTCYDDYLPPPLSTAKTPSGSMRTSPFYDANGDLCGDIEKNVTTLRNVGGTTVSSGPQGPPAIIDIPCIDFDGDGFLEVNACVSWENNKNIDNCTSVAGTVPGTPSKCNCDIIRVGSIIVEECSTDGDCLNSDLCTVATCVAGSCLYSPVICTAKDQCHIAGTCDSATGLCSNPEKPDDTPCDNGNTCFFDDTCQNGVCTNGTPVSCNTPGICRLSVGTCINGACTYEPAPNATSCGQDMICQSGQCISIGGCQTVDDCAPRDCLDVACINGNCVYGPSEDGTTCGFDDVCFNGSCVECNVAADCRGTNVCNLATCTPDHLCAYQQKDCTVGKTNCTIDYCDPIVNPQEGCIHTPSDDLCGCGDQCKLPICGPNGCALEFLTGTPCNDGSNCTANDTCNNGECSGINTCIAPNTCSTASCEAGECIITGNCVCPEFCNEETSTGTCIQCDDTHPCPATLACVNNICVGCAQNSDCTGGDRCTIARCVENECRYTQSPDCEPENAPVGLPPVAPTIPTPMPPIFSPPVITEPPSKAQVPVATPSVPTVSETFTADDSISNSEEAPKPPKTPHKTNSCSNMDTKLQDLWMWLMIFIGLYLMKARNLKLKA